MDPNQTLKDILDSCLEQDRESLRSNLENLLDWVDSGGFVPKVTRVDMETYSIFTGKS